MQIYGYEVKSYVQLQASSQGIKSRTFKKYNITFYLDFSMTSAGACTNSIKTPCPE